MAGKTKPEAVTMPAPPTLDRGRRVRLSQEDVPGYALEQALRVPRAIASNYAYKPTRPLNVAAAMDMQPNSGPFRTLCGASIAYGLTKGGWNAAEIAIEPLGLRIVRPLKEGDDLAAKREALLRPKVVGEFLRQYDGAPLPIDTIARNVLLDNGVPPERTERVWALILEGATALGLLKEIKGRKYVDLKSSVDAEVLAASPAGQRDLVRAPDDDGDAFDTGEMGESSDHLTDVIDVLPRPDDAANRRRVFVTHGSNKAFVEPIRKLLGFGELEAVVSVDRQSVSQPVPDKVMQDMRSCGAAIIHVDEEMKLLDSHAKEHVVLNPNVLIEIGAAMALFGRRFILVVKEGTQLPSNLQGLYEVRYKGEGLDGDATIRLLEAINDIKNHPLPARYPEGAN